MTENGDFIYPIISLHFQTKYNESIVKQHVTENGILLRYVPVEKRTAELCTLAVANDGLSILHVPIEQLTSDICAIAISQNGKSLLCIYDSLRSQTNNIEINDIITAESCVTAVKQWGDALYYIMRYQPLFVTTKLIVSAVNNDGLAIRHVFTSRINSSQVKELYNFCLVSVSQNGLALKHIPFDFHTPALYLASLSQNGTALQFVPVEKQTRELCMVAVDQTVHAIQYIPNEHFAFIQKQYNINTCSTCIIS